MTWTDVRNGHGARFDRTRAVARAPARRAGARARGPGRLLQVFGDRVKESTTTAGAVALVLGGTVLGFQPFAAVCLVGARATARSRW